MGSLFLFYFILQRDLGRVFKVKCYDNFFKTQKFYFGLFQIFPIFICIMTNFM